MIGYWCDSLTLAGASVRVMRIVRGCALSLLRPLRERQTSNRDKRGDLARVATQLGLVDQKPSKATQNGCVTTTSLSTGNV
jgi:hypothetical protein